MFVEADRPLPLPYQTATQALHRALVDGGLVTQSRRAVAEGLMFVMPVGPRGSGPLGHEVLVRVLPVNETASQMRVALRWEATRASGRLFPTLDGDLTLQRLTQETSRLRIVASYTPPLGTVGVIADRILMSKIAYATMAALLREIADQLDALA